MRVNVCLVHPPSIYDFRTKNLRSGPISDVVPSTPLFEMYPVGFISMLNSLVDNGYTGRISNIAVLMLYSKGFNPEKYLSSIEADIFGIDLHWLPHVHGAINLARIIKELHPNSKVLLGGFSATYFAQEILQDYPFIDYVLRGDLQETSIVRLAEAVESGKDVSGIANLGYRSPTGIKFNPISSSPDDIDKVFLNYGLLMKNAIKYADVRAHLPYKVWIKNPSAMTLIEHGCQLNCGFCGGSNYTFSKSFKMKSPLFRKPDRVVEELEIIQNKLGTPVFIAGDINLAGEKFTQGFLRASRDRGIDIPLLTEYFVPPPESYFRDLSKVFPSFTAEISPDSSIESIRERTGRSYNNVDLEKSIEFARQYGCKKFDIYFTIGLPGQTRNDVLQDVAYSEKLMSRYVDNGMQMYAFLSPLTPFLDPGSIFYEMHERYGIKLFASKLKDYYDVLDKGKSWEDYISYETQEMSRKDIVDVTYESGKKMAQARERLGIISADERSFIMNNIEAYLTGTEIMDRETMAMHLNYTVKEIEWSKRHHLTFSSFLILLYRYYNTMRDYLNV